MDPLPGINPTESILEEQKLRAKQKMQNIAIQQEARRNDFTEFTELALFNPLAMKKKFETLEKKMEARVREAHAEGSEDDASEAEALAKSYESKNPELSSRVLLILSSRLNQSDTVDDILRKFGETYADPTLADDALDFLIESAKEGSEMQEMLEKAKSSFNELYGREIRAGRNIAEQAREFSQAGLGSPTALRDLYRDIVANPRDPHTLFDELTQAFSYTKLKKVIDFVLHSLGADMKAKGPSISRGELERLFTESRIMQAFEGLYKFFQKRIKLIEGQFEMEDLAMPPSLTFEVLAKQLMQLLKERYPSSAKILQMAMALGISSEIIAQLIVFTQYRDAMRNISPRLFKSERHRQELLNAILEALGDLDEMLEEENEDDDDEEDEL